MKLRRTLPAICIWVVFVLFDIVMVASSSYFSGLFPSENLLVYVGIFTALSILAMSILTFALGRLSDHLMVHDFVNRIGFRTFYDIVIALIIVAGIWYRLELLGDTAGDITGKFSLYENAMVGGKNLTPEYDLLSIIYSAVLKFILFFTGNIISVPFFFQIACFTVFMILGFFTVRILLGKAAALVFTAYVAFMPVFTPAFTGLELSTDYLFMAMFGFELLFVALFLRGAYKGIYKSAKWVLWYLIVGLTVGFMAYVDAGTIIMILPFLMAPLFLYGKSPKEEVLRLVVIVMGALLAFFGMVAQEAGFEMMSERLSNWASYYFHNLNIISMFWTYTDHKLLYLITVVAMSGVLVGFWKNRKTEKISPWLLSLIFMFATVPFMGATRMNTQAFVTVYYALILGCVASLITLPADEGGEAVLDAAANGEPGDETETEEDGEAQDDAEEEIEASKGAGISEVVEPEEGYLDEDEEESVPAGDSISAADESETEKRYIPEGMVLPEDDEDVDLTPRMKMPEFKGGFGPDGKQEKIHIYRPGEKEVAKEVAETPKEETPKAEPKPEPKDDFDIAFRPGDDFDI